MTKFEFFTNREERWGDSMRALWGNLSICSILDHVDLPYHMVGELLSISHLKVWGEHPKAPGWYGLPPGKGRRCLRGRGLWYGLGVDQSSPGPGIYDDGGIRNSIHLHLQWAQLAIRLNPVI